MAFEEASWLMRSSPSIDIERHSEADAMSERIREWLATPEGSVAHDPSWGHNLSQFKHDPLTTNHGFETLVIMAISRKIPLDIDNLRLISVSVKITGIDSCLIAITHQYGTDINQIAL